MNLTEKAQAIKEQSLTGKVTAYACGTGVVADKAASLGTAVLESAAAGAVFLNSLRLMTRENEQTKAADIVRMKVMGNYNGR